MQSRGDQDEAEHKQPRADEDMECPGLDHPGQNKKERPKRKDHKMRRKVTRQPGLEHPERNKQQGPPLPRLEHQGTPSGQTPRLGASGTEQGAGAAAPGLEHPRTSGCRTPRTRTTATESKRSGHEGEAGEMQGSGVEDQAEEKQRNQEEDKPQEMQRCTQVDEDAGMRWSSQGDEAGERPRGAKRRSPRRCRVGVTKTRPSISSQEETKTWSAQGWIIRGKTRRSGQSKKTTKCGGRSHDNLDWNIWGGTSSWGRHPPDESIKGQVAARRPGPGASETEQGAGATAPWTGTSEV